MVVLSPAEGPPAFLRLVGHPLRWRLLSELARSDFRVRELRDLVGEPQNLVSYHLAQLREARLVQARRSSYDRRDTYYSADLHRCAGLLAGVGEALHPGLRLIPSPPDQRRPQRRAAPTRVLFLCTGNSARSQMAEALVEQGAGAGVEAVSAGSHPKPVHPNAVKVMRAFGVDLDGRRSKHVSEFTGERFDYVISLCDRAREECPRSAGAQTFHWSMPNPAAEGDTDAETYPAFERTAAKLETRVGLLLHLIECSAQARR